MVGYPSLSLPEQGGDCHGVWRSLVARFVRDEEVAGSNPVTPTVVSLISQGSVTVGQLRTLIAP